MSTDKKVGRPRIPRTLARVTVRTTVDPVTMRWLQAQEAPIGRVIDRLVAAAKQGDER